MMNITKASGLEGSVTAVESMFTWTDQNLKELGKMTELMEKELLGTPMVTDTKVNGLMAALTAEVSQKLSGEQLPFTNQIIGTLYLSSGDRYTGDWKDGKRHGHGTYFYRSVGIVG
jgi:hypothetical protein